MWYVPRMIWKIKYKEKWRQDLNVRAVERVKGEVVGGGEAAGGRGQSAKFVQRKTLMLCLVWKMTCFPGPDGSFFSIFLAFSDWTDFARRLLLMLELGGPGSCFLANAGWPCCSGEGEFRVSESSSSLCFWGDGRLLPAADSATP